MIKKGITIVLCLATIFLAGCSPFNSLVQSAISETQAVWTIVPTQIPKIETRVETQVVTQIATRVVIQTPVPSGPNCGPITGVTYSDISKVIIQLQAYVSKMPDVKSISYAIPERLYSNTSSELVHITYVSTDGKVYSRRYIIYIEEFSWKEGIYSIDGQCWIDPPH
jgi:PBP1b-binding outer membrane lipoprotein LpoB